LTQKTKNIWVTLFFISSVFLIIFSITFKIDPPKDLFEFLKNEDILLEEPEISIRLFPLPHAHIDDIEFEIKGSTNFQFQEISLNLDILDLLLRKKQKISSIEIEKFKLRVLDEDDIETGIDERYATVEKIMAEIHKFITLIPNQFNLTKWLEVENFDLYVDSVSKEEPILTAKDFILKKTRKEKPYIKISAKGYMGKWLESKVFIDVFKNQETEQNWLKQTDIRIESHVTLDKIIESFTTMGLHLSGEGKVKNIISMTFPLERLSHSHQITLDKFLFLNIKDYNLSYVNIKPKIPLEIRAGGTANIDILSLQQFNMTYDNRLFTSYVDWKYEDFLFKQIYNPGTTIPWKIISNSFGNFIPEKAANYLNSMTGTVYPVSVAYNPWQGRFGLEFFMNLNLPMSMQNDKRTPETEREFMSAQGFFKGNNALFESREVYLESKIFNFLIHDAKLNFADNSRLTGDLEGELYLSKMFDNAKGSMYIQSRLNCSIAKNDCEREKFTIEGANLEIPKTSALQVYQYINVNLISSIQKAFSASNTIKVHSAMGRGYLKGNKIYIQEGYLRSELGEFKISGYYNPLEGNGDINVGVLPFHVEQVLDPIPLLGKYIKSGLSYAGVSLKVKVRNNKISLENISVEKIQNNS